MSDELKLFTINMKSLSQAIEDPIVAGSGDANGHTLRVIFTQHAEAHFTPETKVYLKWRNLSTDTKGYNAFTCVQREDPPIWEIHYPKEMLYEGDVLCTIEIVDSISIAPSVSFRVHVLADPFDGTQFTASNDYSEFQKAVIDMATLSASVDAQMNKYGSWFKSIRETFEKIKTEHEVNNQKIDMFTTALDKVYKDLYRKSEQDKQELINMINNKLP